MKRLLKKKAEPKAKPEKTVDPIERIEWRHAEELTANDYNPNMVMTPELKQIERNLSQYGWIQPVLINSNNVIIDGYHRVCLSRDSKRLQQKYGGMVPCCIMDISDAAAIMLTVRMNRAKGTHAAVRMADLVIRLIDEYKLEASELAEGMGMTKKEIEVLYENSIFITKKLGNTPYSKAWVPKESRNDPKPDSN